MLDLINQLAGFIGDLFQTHPYQHGTADMIADDTSTTALTTIHVGQLFIFTVKLPPILVRQPHASCVAGVQS